MTDEKFGTGVQGSSRARGKSATQDRQGDKRGSIKVALIVIGIILVLGVGLSLANADIGIWGWLVVAAILSVAASRLENPKVTLSSVLRTTSWVVVAILLINTGFGAWAKSVVLDTNDWFACRSGQVEACTTKAITAPCGKEFVSTKDCQKVILTSKNEFTYRALPGHCPGYDRPDALTIQPIEDYYTNIYRSKYEGETIVHFYSLEQGQEFMGYTCPTR